MGVASEAGGQRARRRPRGTSCVSRPVLKRIVGLAVLGAQAILDRDSELGVTIEAVKQSADDLALVLAAV